MVGSRTPLVGANFASVLLMGVFFGAGTAILLASRAPLPALLVGIATAGILVAGALGHPRSREVLLDATPLSGDLANTLVKASLVVAFFGFVVGVTGGLGIYGSTLDTAETNQIESEPSALVLSADQLGDEWERKADTPKSVSAFEHQESETTVKSRAAVYGSGEAATKAFDDRKESASAEGYAIQSANVGDEAFYYQDSAGWGVVVFREKNAIGIVRYGPANSPKRETIEFAKKMAYAFTR